MDTDDNGLTYLYLCASVVDLRTALPGSGSRSRHRLSGVEVDPAPVRGAKAYLTRDFG